MAGMSLGAQRVRGVCPPRTVTPRSSAALAAPSRCVGPGLGPALELGFRAGTGTGIGMKRIFPGCRRPIAAALARPRGAAAAGHASSCSSLFAVPPFCSWPGELQLPTSRGAPPLRTRLCLRTPSRPAGPGRRSGSGSARGGACAERGFLSVWWRPPFCGASSLSRSGSAAAGPGAGATRSGGSRGRPHPPHLPFASVRRRAPPTLPPGAAAESGSRPPSWKTTGSPGPCEWGGGGEVGSGPGAERGGGRAALPGSGAGASRSAGGAEGAERDGACAAGPAAGSGQGEREGSAAARTEIELHRSKENTGEPQLEPGCNGVHPRSLRGPSPEVWGCRRESQAIAGGHRPPPGRPCTAVPALAKFFVLCRRWVG